MVWRKSLGHPDAASAKGGELLRLQVKRGSVNVLDVSGELGVLRKEAKGFLKKKVKSRFLMLKANKLEVYEKKGVCSGGCELGADGRRMRRQSTSSMSTTACWWRRSARGGRPGWRLPLASSRRSARTTLLATTRKRSPGGTMRCRQLLSTVCHCWSGRM